MKVLKGHGLELNFDENAWKVYCRKGKKAAIQLTKNLLDLDTGTKMYNYENSVLYVRAVFPKFPVIEGRIDSKREMLRKFFKTSL